MVTTKKHGHSSSINMNWGSAFSFAFAMAGEHGRHLQWLISSVALIDWLYESEDDGWCSSSARNPKAENKADGWDALLIPLACDLCASILGRLSFVDVIS